MAFNFLSKNILGGVTTLLLIILLTQSRLFDFLINTPLGRLFLIATILGISYCHKIFGVVALLFVIIIFNQSDFSFMEGFTDTDTPTTTTTDPASNSVTAASILEKKGEAKTKIDELARLGLLAQHNAATTSSSTATTVAPISTETFMGREGFNTVDREGSILRGKRSNEVPVFSNARNQSDNVEATDKSVFSGSYASV
jgi:hypothetical protein